jgi:hypothetical protein
MRVLAPIGEDKEELFALALEDKFEDIKKLIDTGKEKGYLTYDQVNDLIPQDVQSPDDLEDLLTTSVRKALMYSRARKCPRPLSTEKMQKSSGKTLNST